MGSAILTIITVDLFYIFVILVMCICMKIFVPNKIILFKIKSCVYNQSILIMEGDHNMARGARKTPVKKLEDELYEVEDSLKKYGGIISDLKEKRKVLSENIKLEKLKELSQMLEEKQISVDDMKAMIEANKK